MLRYIAHPISFEFGEALRMVGSPNNKKEIPKPNAKDWIASKTIKKNSCPAVGWAPPPAMGHKIGPKAIAAIPTTTVTSVTFTQGFKRCSFVRVVTTTKMLSGYIGWHIPQMTHLFLAHMG
jgi:hypothetical protein